MKRAIRIAVAIATGTAMTAIATVAAHAGNGI